MDRIRGFGDGMIGALMVMAILLAAAPAQARTVSYRYDENFSLSIPYGYTPQGRAGGDDRVTVNDPGLRQDQCVRIENLDGVDPCTVTCAAVLSPPANSATAATYITVGRYARGPGGITNITGGFNVSGQATTIVPRDATAYSTAIAEFQAEASGASGSARYGPRVEARGARGGRVELTFELIAQVNEEVLRLLLQGLTDLSGDTSILWDSSVIGKNLTIHAPAKSGNQVQFMLDLPGPYNLNQGKLEIIIRDGVLQGFNKTGKIFEAVYLLQEGDDYFLFNLGPLAVDYHLGEFPTDKPQLRMQVQTIAQGQLAQGANAIPGIDLLLLD
jgi:hypothetical protein